MQKEGNNTNSSENIRSMKNNYDIKQDAENFSKQVDRVLNGTFSKRSMLTLLTHTPQPLIDIGLSDLPITMTQKHLSTIINESGNDKNANYHNLGIDIVKQLPVAINNPLDIVESSTRDDSVVLTTYLADKNENTIVASIKIDGSGLVNQILIDTNVMTSAYGKNNYETWMNKNLENNKLLYDIDRGVIKKVDVARFQLPRSTNSTTNTNGSVITNSVTHNSKNVNTFTTNSNSNYTQNSKNNTNSSENIRSMKKNTQIVKQKAIEKELHNRIQNAILSKNSKGRTYLGNVSSKVAKKVKSLFNIETIDRRHVLADNDIRHMIKEHGNPEIEKTKGQIAITLKDIEKIPEILNSYDRIVAGTDNKQGKTIRYIKKYADNTSYVVEVVPEKGNALKIKTMWKKPVRVTNSKNTPSSTSKTKSNLSYSTSKPIIQQNTENVKNEDIRSGIKSKFFRFNQSTFIYC